MPSEKRWIIVRRATWALTAVALAGAGFVAYRSYRLADIAWDVRSQVRYLIQNGGTIGAKPANATFSVDYLEAIFGDDPELLEQLKAVVQRGISETPALSLGEVSAMIVTYRKNSDERVTDVVAHVVGGFPLGKRPPGFHRDGYFKHQLDDNLWTMGNTALAFLGRDMVLFAEEEVAARQTDIIEGILQGNIIPLVENMGHPIYYTAVFPDPRRVVPKQLRHHVQAIVMKGFIEPARGRMETILLTTSPRSATYTLTVVNDVKTAAEIALKVKWKGLERETAWGTVINPWWAYEMVKTSEEATLEKEENIVRIRTEYERVMVNAVMKTLERMGRDMTQMRLSMDEKMDPRTVDAIMRTRKPYHYWSEEHRWGPHWPFMPTEEELEQMRQEEEARKAAAMAARAEARAARQAAAAEQRPE